MAPFRALKSAVTVVVAVVLSASISSTPTVSALRLGSKPRTGDVEWDVLSELVELGNNAAHYPNYFLGLTAVGKIAAQLQQLPVLPINASLLNGTTVLFPNNVAVIQLALKANPSPLASVIRNTLAFHSCNSTFTYWDIVAGSVTSCYGIKFPFLTQQTETFSVSTETKGVLFKRTDILVTATPSASSTTGKLAPLYNGTHFNLIGVDKILSP